MEITLYILLGIASGLCLLLALLYFKLHSDYTTLTETHSKSEGELSSTLLLKTESEAALASLREQHEECSKKLNEREEQLRNAIADRAALAAKLEASEQRLKDEQSRNSISEQEREKSEEAMRIQFKSIANDIMDEQSRRFKQTNQESLDQLLKPFKQNIAEFRERIERIHANETEQHGALKNELKNLMELNRQITTETTNLTRALKGDSKVQGDFGEMILDTILSSSNLIKGVHYQTQDTLKGESGENLRPDVILNLPDKKQIIIDSKTSLTAYANYTAEEEHNARAQYLKAHIDSVRKHVQELSQKSYQNLLSSSPDFVIMFIPNESAFLTAMQADPNIWAEAYNKKVVISSPTNLFALLKLVDNLWQRNDLERNTLYISDCGSKLYDQLVAFTETLLGVEKGLKAAHEAYNEAYKRFTQGNNNLVRLGEKMVKLNLKVKRRIPQSVLESADLEQESLPSQPSDEES